MLTRRGLFQGAFAGLALGLCRGFGLRVDTEARTLVEVARRPMTLIEYVRSVDSPAIQLITELLRLTSPLQDVAWALSGRGPHTFVVRTGLPR